MDTCGRNTVRNMREMSKDEVKGQVLRAGSSPMKVKT